MVAMLKEQGAKAVSIYLLKVFNYRLIGRYLKGSYSQKGEDTSMHKFFHYKQNGFYIDIGAFHPDRLSNTKYFYDKGWHGINIEPNPQRIKQFEKERARDINLNIGIGNIHKSVDFYQFEQAALSSFSLKEANALIKLGYRCTKKIKVPMRSLRSIMINYVKKAVDFMSIDTEGFDMEVLKSNDWKKYRPTLLCIETIDFIDLLTSGRKDSDRKSIIDRFLYQNGYVEYVSNGLNTIYRNIRN